MDCKTDKLDEAGEERMLAAALNSPTMLHPVPPRLARRIRALSSGMTPRCRLLFARRRWPAAAAALCALAAAGAVWWGELSGRAAVTDGGGVVPRAAASGETGGSSPVALASTPVTPDSPAPQVADVPFVADVPSTTLSKDQNMNTTTRSAALGAATALALAAAPPAASADEYQFIISGDPVAAATEGMTARRSTPPGPLEMREHAVARSRTTALTSTKPSAFTIIVR